MQLSRFVPGLAVATIAAAGLTQAADAAVITLVEYQFGGSAAQVQNDVTATNLVQSGFATFTRFNGNDSRLNGGSLHGDFRDLGGNSMGTLTFMVTPDTLPINYDSLSFIAADASFGGSTVALSYQIDGGSVVAAPGATPTNTLPNLGAGGSGAVRTFDISALQNVSEKVTFTITADNSSNLIFFIDDLTVTGEVIPEPASLALLAAGTVLIAPFRRRPAA